MMTAKDEMETHEDKPNADTTEEPEETKTNAPPPEKKPSPPAVLALPAPEGSPEATVPPQPSVSLPETKSS